MKKIWKSLCGVCLTLACGTGFVGCGKDNGPTSIDIDGDGTIASWEQIFTGGEDIFGKEEEGEVALVGDIEHIGSKDQLLAINEKVAERKIYVLDSDIDLGGEAVSINLGSSELYGEGHMIYNFKLGKATTEGLVSVGDFTNISSNCLFYNGVRISNVLMYLGSQKVELTESESMHYAVSPIFNTGFIESVAVRGQINVVANVSNRDSAWLDCSLLYTGMTTLRSIDEVSRLEENTVTIKDVVVDGRILLDHKKDSRVKTIAGSVASTLTAHSTINNAYSNVHIDASISDGAIGKLTGTGTGNIGGLVGINNGFICNSQATGHINIDNKYSTEAVEYVGSLVGVNQHLAEVKNCVTNTSITVDNAELEDALNSRDGKYFIGGAVGHNNGGILEIIQSDATVVANNINNVVAGGLCGRTTNGVISYIICRGSVNITNVRSKVEVAQISGESHKGFIDRVLATTNINVDVHSVVPMPSVSVGMGVIFEHTEESSGQEGVTLINFAPYFRKVLIGGKTSVGVLDTTWPSVQYKLGLRNPFQKLIDEEMETPEGGFTPEDYETFLPYVFEDIYYSNEAGNQECVFEVAEYIPNASGGYEIVEKFNPTIEYVSDSRGNKLILKATLTDRWLMNYMDFKGYFNHQEVNLLGKIELAKLHFTLDADLGATSYFGKASYHGELAHFDYAIDEFVSHNSSSYGGCDYDTTDEFFSLIYHMVETERDKTTSTTDKAHLYTIKFGQKCFEDDDEGEVVEGSSYDGMSQSTHLLVEGIQKVLGCLGVSTTQVTKYTKTFIDMGSEEFEGEDVMQYVQITFQDETMKYTMTIDAYELQNTEDPTSQVVHINFVANKINK